MLVSVGLHARIAVRMSMAEQLLTPSQQVTGSIPGNDFFQDLLSAMYTHAWQLPHCSQYHGMQMQD